MPVPSSRLLPSIFRARTLGGGSLALHVRSVSRDPHHRFDQATVRHENTLYITDLKVFGDFGELDDPTIDWRTTLSLRLSRTLSLDYTLDALEIPQVIDKTQIRQNILLRFSWDLF